MRMACPECFEVFSDHHDESALTSLKYHKESKHQYLENGSQIAADAPTEQRLKNALVQTAKDFHDRGLADFAVDTMMEDARNQFRRERMRDR